MFTSQIFATEQNETCLFYLSIVSQSERQNKKHDIKILLNFIGLKREMLR